MSTQLNEAITAIAKKKPRRIVTLTGAGISAESGVPTFRGAGGLWENYRAEDLATPEAFARDPHLVWKWYEWRRQLIRACEPNAAHYALAALDRERRAISHVIVTQNVDALHIRAGSTSIIELHGNIMQTRCTREETTTDSHESFSELPPKCSCGALLRPNVVWFGEALPPQAWDEAVEAVTDAELVLIVGTSGVVYPAAGLIGFARDALTIEVNPEATPLSTACEFAIGLNAGAAVPELVSAIRRSHE